MEKALNVVLVSDYAHPAGGAERVMLGSGVELARRGHRVWLFAGEPSQQPIEGVKVVATGQRAWATGEALGPAARRMFWNPEAALGLERLLGGLLSAPTVVHVHSWVQILSGSVFRTIQDSGLPLVVTMHNFALDCPTTVLYDFPWPRICPLRGLSWPCMRRECTGKGWAQKTLALGRFAAAKWRAKPERSADAYVAVSGFCREVMAPRLPDGTAVQVVENPVDATRDGPAGVAANATFGYVGRLVPEKGVTTLARVATAAGVKLRLVGDGPTRGEVEAAGEVTGWVSPDEVKREMRGFRALVIPSVWLETAGLVALEAASMGLPVVVSDTCAARDYVEHGVTGLHFHAGSVEGLAEALRQMTPEVAERMGRAAYERFWADPPTVEKHVDRLLEVYRSVLSKRQVVESSR
jgi:glycosyltransferase involved in cell wall biosynthesis